MVSKSISYERYLEFVELAAGHAMKSPLKWKYACIIINGNKIVSIGYNSYKKTLVSGLYSTHAEIDALNKCKNKKDLKGAIMIVVRVNISKELPYKYLTATPCKECERKINKCMKEYGISKCYFTGKIK